MFVQFFARASPDSTVANPRFMMNTSIAAIMIQRLFTVNRAFSAVFTAVSSAPSTEINAHSRMAHDRIFFIFMQTSNSVKS